MRLALSYSTAHLVGLGNVGCNEQRLTAFGIDTCCHGFALAGRQVEDDYLGALGSEQL